MSKPLILVAGATGAQGKSVAHALASQGFPVRGLTRNPDADKAKSSAIEGMQLVKATLQNKADLKAAFSGVERAFLLTQFWESMDAGDEILQGKNFIDAAKAAGVKFIVFSSLEDEGEHDVPHLRSKAVIEAYLKASGVPYATVRYPWYYENWINFMPPKKDEGKDSYTLVTPTGQEAWHQMSVADGGPVVAKILADPAAYEGKGIGLAGDKLSGAQVAAKLAEISGKTVNFYPMPIEEFAKLGFPGADELAEMFKVFLETGGAVRDVALTKELNPATLSFDQWAEENKEMLISALFTPK